MALELGFRLPCGDIHEDAYDFVNDLPGVSLQKMSFVADSDLELAKELFYKLERAAERMLKNDLLLKLGKSKKLLAVTSMTYRNMVGVDKSGTGYIEFTKYNLSPYIKIKINTLIVKFLEAQTITLYTTDCGVTTTRDVAVTVGINHIPINYEMKSETGRIHFTASGWQTGSIPLGRGCNRCRSNCNNFDIDYNIGFNLMATVDQDAIIEMYKKQLSYPHLMAWYICFMQEILNTDRISYITQMSQDQARENWATYTANTPASGNTPADIGPYHTSINALVQGIEDSLEVSETIEEVQCAGVQIIQTIS